MSPPLPVPEPPRRVRRGLRLEVGEPTAAEEDWIFEALQEPSIYAPLSLPRAPTREQLERGRIPLIEEKGREMHSVGSLIVRRRADRSPFAFWLHYGWDHGVDSTRELDTAVPGDTDRSLGDSLESHILAALFLFGHGRAKRLRWRVTVGASRASLLWYERLGARPIGVIHEPHSVSGAEQRRVVYELTKAELIAVLDAVGASLETEMDAWPVAPWELLRRRP